MNSSQTPSASASRVSLPNIATMLELNALRFADRPVFLEKQQGVFTGPDWHEFVDTIRLISARLRYEYGLQRGDTFAIVSPNRLEMLELELAIMAAGAIAVPIFPAYPQSTMDRLLAFCDARFVAVAGSAQLERITRIDRFSHVFTFDEIPAAHAPTLIPFNALLRRDVIPANWHMRLATDVSPDSVCLMQYTSGTTAKRKLVQLTHRNILSQQAALDEIWELGPQDRMLSYLPWHHSFGGIFELFNALYRGVSMALEPSIGKDPHSVLEHWQTIRPTVFFSVPKVYQALVDLSRGHEDKQAALFHPDLKFVFTAAAPLPEYIAQEFEGRGVRIVEGWGLTETAPCCTLTGISSRRQSGIVGHAMPGVRLRIAEDGEIQVNGPNVMRGYYNNDEANLHAFTADGWFRTGDVGAITSEGLKLIGRNDRIFKLSNGEKVVSADVERVVQNSCHFLTYAVLEGGGQSFPVVLVFPNRALMKSDERPAARRLDSGQLLPCDCPQGARELAQCLRRCLTDANIQIEPKFSRVPYAILVDDELSIDAGTLTPSMKVIAKNVLTKYQPTIGEVYRKASERLSKESSAIEDYAAFGEGIVEVKDGVYLIPLGISYAST